MWIPDSPMQERPARGCEHSTVPASFSSCGDEQKRPLSNEESPEESLPHEFTEDLGADIQSKLLLRCQISSKTYKCVRTLILGSDPVDPLTLEIKGEAPSAPFCTKLFPTNCIRLSTVGLGIPNCMQERR